MSGATQQDNMTRGEAGLERSAGSGKSLAYYRPPLSGGTQRLVGVLGTAVIPKPH